MREVVARNWREYGIEAAGLGLFMISACGFATLLEHSASPLRRLLDDPFQRRLLMGLAMGLTAAAIIYSPWGKRSGAHLNPAVTLGFLRLGKIRPLDAAGYGGAQFLGGIAGVAVMAVLLGERLAEPGVEYVVTRPGRAGVAAAFLAETAISFGLFLVVLVATNARRLLPFTGALAGLLLALYIAFEAPLSGMSMNPARTLASAVSAGSWTAIWLYFVAPPLGMLFAAEVHRRLRGPDAVFCAKLQHDERQRCLFCEWRAERAAASARLRTPASGATVEEGSAAGNPAAGGDVSRVDGSPSGAPATRGIR